MALMIPPVKLKWLEHLNSSWITEDSESIATREGVSVLYSKLLANKEAVLLPQQVLCLKGPQLPLGYSAYLYSRMAFAIV